MAEILESLSKTPLPIILVVAGVIFLLLSVAERISGALTVPETRKTQALYLGLVLLVIGVGLSLPPMLTSSGGDTVINEATPGDEDIDWEEVKWAKMSSEHRELWSKLGWTAQSWAGSEPPPPTETMAFEKLSPDEKDAVRQLGYTAAKWDKSN